MGQTEAQSQELKLGLPRAFQGVCKQKSGVGSGSGTGWNPGTKKRDAVVPSRVIIAELNAHPRGHL